MLLELTYLLGKIILYVFSIVLLVYVSLSSNKSKVKYISDKSSPDIKLPSFITDLNFTGTTQGSWLGVTKMSTYDCDYGGCYYYTCLDCSYSGYYEDDICYDSPSYHLYATKSCLDNCKLWHFTSDGCSSGCPNTVYFNYCYPAAKYGYSKCVREKNSSYIENGECTKYNDVYFWKETGINYQTNTNYLTFVNNLVYSNQNCPEGMHKCGLLFKEKYNLCLPNEDECPINVIRFSDYEDMPTDYNYTRYNMTNGYAFVSNDPTDEYIISNIYADSSIYITYTGMTILDTDTISNFLKSNPNTYKYLSATDPHDLNETELKDLDSKGKAYLKANLTNYKCGVYLQNLKQEYQDYLTFQNERPIYLSFKAYCESKFNKSYYVGFMAAGFALLNISFIISMIFIGKRMGNEGNEDKNNNIYLLFYLFLADIPYFIFCIVSIVKGKDYYNSLIKAEKFEGLDQLSDENWGNIHLNLKNAKKYYQFSKIFMIVVCCIGVLMALPFIILSLRKAINNCNKIIVNEDNTQKECLELTKNEKNK